VNAGEKYVPDADALVNLYLHFKRRAINALKKLAKRDALRIPEGVARELLRKSDRLSNLMTSLKKQASKFPPSLFVRLRAQRKVREEVVRLEKLYGEEIRVGGRVHPGFWASRAGRKAKDSQVVAAAKVLRGVAVSDDKAIALACALEDVSCIGWTEFARRLGLMTKQLELFGTAASTNEPRSPSRC